MTTFKHPCRRPQRIFAKWATVFKGPPRFTLAVKFLHTAINSPELLAKAPSHTQMCGIAICKTRRSAKPADDV